MTTLNILLTTPQKFYLLLLLAVVSAWTFWISKKVVILKYISRWQWGRRVVESQYFKTMIRRAERKTWRVNKAIRIAKEMHKSSNLKQYVMEVAPGQYWVGTGKQWTIERKHYPKCMYMWPVKDAIYQTR